MTPWIRISGRSSRSPHASDENGIPAALVVDRVDATEPRGDRRVWPPPTPALHLAGVITLDDGLLLIEDLDAVLSLDEERAIDASLREPSSLS